MPGSSSLSGGGIPGLSLRGWVLFNGGNGAIVKQFNVSNLVRNAVGDYTLTLAQAMADIQILVDAKAYFAGGASQSLTIGAIQSITVNGLSFKTYNGASADPSYCWLGIYG